MLEMGYKAISEEAREDIQTPAAKQSTVENKKLKLA